MAVIFAGIDIFANKFSAVVTFIKRKQYDFLDFRRPEFEKDYKDFKAQINTLQVILLHILVLI